MRKHGVSKDGPTARRPLAVLRDEVDDELVGWVELSRNPSSFPERGRMAAPRGGGFRESSTHPTKLFAPSQDEVLKRECHDADDDDGGGDGGDAHRPWDRYALRAPRRPQRPPVRRPLQGLGPHQGGASPPRAGHRLHGARRGARDRAAPGLCRGARPRPPQHQRGAAHRLCDECAGARADRTDSRCRYRARHRTPARDPRPGRDHQPAGRLLRAHPVARRCLRAGRQGARGHGNATARTGRARMRHRRVGPQRAGAAGRPLRAAGAGDRRGRDRGRGGRASARRNGRSFSAAAAPRARRPR